MNPTKGYQPIHLACENGAVQVITSLLSHHGARVDTFDYQGNTALHYAARYSGGPAISPVELVKMLVNNFNASVTVKNAEGQTPYDVSSDTMVRQYLLPLQLQQETQTCFDNGGQGLPPGIDMGGHHMSTNIAPPPSSSTFMSNDPHAANQQYHGSHYENNINSLMAPPPMTRTPGSTLSTPRIQSNSSMPPPSPYSPAPPSMSTVPLSPTDSLSVGGGVASSVSTPASMVYPPPQPANMMSPAPPIAFNNTPTIHSQFPTPPMSTNFTNPTPEPVVSPEPAKPLESETVAESTPLPISDDNIEGITEATKSISFNAPPIRSSAIATPPSTATSTPMAAPVVEATSSLPNALESVQQQVIQPPIQTNSQTNTSNIPPRTFIKPDGFHSSASDPNLQQKYGHIKKKINIDPPPTNMMPPPPRPYASTSSLVHADNSSTQVQNRYLAYNAVTGQASSLQHKFPPPPVMGGSRRSASAGGMMGPPPLSNFSVFNPGSNVGRNARRSSSEPSSS